MAIQVPTKSTPTSRPPTPTSTSTAVEQSLPIPTFEGERVPSVIPPDFNGLVMVTGFRGRGKTTFSLGADRGENICMLDFESKGEALASQIKVGGYFPILDICADTHGFNFRPIQIFNATRTILEAMPSNRFTTLILDNAGWLQEGCLAEVKRSPVTYGIDPERALKGNYGGAWPGVNYILKSLFSIAQAKGVRVIVSTFQPRTAWNNGVPMLNKFKITDLSVWHELSVLSLVLVPGLPKFMPAPSALVMKEQLAQMEWDEETLELKVRRRLPTKLPKASFASIYNYLRNPADLLAPTEGEAATTDELNPWLPTFGKEQLAEVQKLAEAMAAIRGASDEDANE